MTGGRARYMSLLSLSVPQKIMFSSIGLMTLVVATAEIGDKTQLLALCLAARFRTQLPIVLGIFAATVLNHLLASVVGVSLASVLTPGNFALGLDDLVCLDGLLDVGPR